MPERTRGLLPPDPRRFGETPLAADEITEVVRVRGPAEDVTWFKSLTAAERGALVVSMRHAPHR